MVSRVKIKNFRGFERFEAKGFTLINVIVGDNGVGKTALLESIWITLAANAQKGLLLRQWRGHDILFQRGSGESIFQGMYADIFHNAQSLDEVQIELWGRGYENRRLRIEKTPGSILVPVEPATENVGETSVRPNESNSIFAPVAFHYRDDKKKERTVRVRLAPNGLDFESTGESLPSAFMYAAQVPVPSAEAAAHFSDLVKRREADKFKKLFMSVFEDITDINVDSSSQVLIADVPWAKQMLALPSLSGGTNRAAAILLAMTAREHGCVLVDEAESGIFHTRHSKFAQALLEFARAYDTQLFLTSHSEEWIERFIAVESANRSDVTFWRMERPDKRSQSRLRGFTVDEFRSGLAAGEMR